MDDRHALRLAGRRVDVAEEVAAFDAAVDNVAADGGELEVGVGHRVLQGPVLSCFACEL
jgi:hypothetical protein